MRYSPVTPGALDRLHLPMIDSSSLPIRFLAALGNYQRQGRFVSSAYGTDIGTTEGYIIVELATAPDLSIAQLSRILAVNKATVSRAVSSLTARGYLKVKSASSPKRKKEITLTEFARTFLETRHRSIQQLYRSCCQRLSPADLRELTQLMNDYCAAEGAPEVSSAPDESSMIVSMRRLARSHQVVGQSFMDSGQSSIVWQVLSLLNYSPTILQASSFIEALSIQPTTLSQTLNRMTSKGWITRHRQGTDRRVKPISITPAGQRALGKIEASAAVRICKGLAPFELPQAERFVALFERYTGTVTAENQTTAHAPHLDAVLILANTPERLTDARAFVIEQSVLTQTHRSLGPVICSPNNTVLTLWREGEISGVLEYSSDRTGQYCNYTVARKVADSVLEANFLLSAAELLLNNIHYPFPIILPPLPAIPARKSKTSKAVTVQNKEELQQLRAKILGKRQALPLQH